MKTKIALAAALLALAGCSTSTVQYGNLRVHNTRWLWSSAGVEGSVVSSNLSLTVKLQQSSAQSEAIAAVAEGVARGLVTAPK